LENLTGFFSSFFGSAPGAAGATGAATEAELATMTVSAIIVKGALTKGIGCFFAGREK